MKAMQSDIFGTGKAGRTCAPGRTMSRLAKAVALFLLSFVGLLGSGAAHAVAITITANTNWSAIATGSGLGGQPAATDTIAVRGGATLTVDVTAGVCKSMQLGTGNGNGTLSFNAGSQATVSGAVTLGNPIRTGSIDMTNGGTLVLGQLTVTTPGTWTPGAGTVNYALTANTTLPAAIGTYNNLTITGGAFTATLGAATTVNGNLLISSGTLDVSTSNFALDVKGNFTNNAAFTQRTGTVTMGGTTAQAIAGSATTTFSGLTITNTSAAVSLSPTTNLVNVSGTLNMNGAATLLTPAAAVVINNAAAAGTITGTGGTVMVTRTAATADYSSQYKFSTNTMASLTVEYAGATAQTVSALTYGGLKINNASGVTLAGNATVNAALTLASGTVTTGANTLITSANCPGSVSRTSGYVIGNLQLTFPAVAGTTTCIYDVGDSIGYAPVTVALTRTGATGGTLAGRVDSGDHPDTIANISRIDQTRSANHYWTLTLGTLATYTSFAATLQFNAGLDSTTNTNNFIVAKKNAGAWIRPTVGTRTATSTQATGITSAQGFGEFAVGELLVGVYKGVNQLIDLREVY